MSKINVYSSSASYAIKVFDTNSTGLKPDDAILVTTGSDPTNAIQINVGEKQDDYIAVTFAGSEPGPTPPGPTPFPYSTVVIGDDEWTSENISWDDNGDGIYKKENVVINGVNYGTVYFYNAEAALRLFNNIEEIYPGWHIATKDDVDTLKNEVNDDNSSLRTTTGWNDDMNGTDSNGFHGEPLGNIYKEDDYEEWNNIGDSYGLWMNNLIEGNPDFDCVEYLNKDNNFYTEWDIDDYNSYYPIRLVKNKSGDNHKITIKPSTNGSVSASPNQGNPGTIVTLSNTPNDYCTFEKYNITGAELTGNTFEIGDSDIDVQGVFVADQYNVSYTNDGHGSLTGTLTTATGGMTTTLTAVPNTHYNLGDITVTGGTVNGKVLTVTSNCTANASYVPKQYTVTYQNNGYGTLTGGVTTATGNSTTTLTATPNNHYSLANYTVTGGTISGNTLTITADCTAKANFTMIQPYTLTLQQTTGGTIGSTKNTGYSGDTATLSYTPAADYTFGSWSVTGGTISGNTFTFGNSNATAKATFNNYVPNRSISASRDWAYTNGKRFNYYNHNANNNTFSLSGLNQQNFIIAVHYKFGSNTTENPMNVMLDVNTLPDGWYLNWNTATNKWSTPANWIEAAEFPYMSNRKTTTYSGNSSLMPIFQFTNYVRNDSVWKANDVTMYGDKLVYPVETSWIKDYDIKYLIEQKYPVVTNHYPERSMFLSAYVNNQLKVSAYGGMQFTTVSSYHFGAGVYYSGGTTSNPKCSAYDGSASYTAGYFNAGRINDAYNWLMSI